ncbi:hypothetical protein DC28_04615 [Spirochaeta lutea]|uniref:Uncharacterized protein n=1 Tax=Spirochaeta lutea TaxID=1480694 RepID=A0A098R088_9SPIO|nr:hypothetical protein DC28_04615 [Spirochaeta lutea]
MGADTDPNRYEYDLQISESTVHLIIKSYRNNKIYNYNEKLWVFNESDKLIQKWDITRIKYKLSNLDDICFISFFEYDSDGRIIEVNELRTNQESNADNILDEFSIKENDFVKRIEFEYSEDLINRVLQYDGNELNSYYYYSNFDNMGNWRTVTQKNLDGEIINIWNRDIIYN